jgi:hypothetical protein
MIPHLSYRERERERERGREGGREGEGDGVTSCRVIS